MFASGSSQTGAWAAERYVSRVGNQFNLSLTTPTVSRMPIVTQGDREDYCNEAYVELFGSQCVEGAINIHGDVALEKNGFSTRSGILSMTRSAQAVRNYIAGLVADGGTAGHIGTAWGLYALSPEWNGVFGQTDDSPVAFDDVETKKILVVMTDGDFTSTQDPNIDSDDAYGYFQAACTLARQQGVEIYAVGFRASQTTETELTQCAGTDTRYFNVENRNSLIRAFERISDSAKQVRISG